MDGVGGGAIGGWALGPGGGGASVELQHGDQRLLDMVANLPRKDVEEAFGVLTCGFSFPVPAVLTAMQKTEGGTPAPLRAVAQGTELPGATIPCTVADVADAAALAWFHHIRAQSPAHAVLDV